MIYVIGIDPGTEMGVAIIGNDGVILSWQDSKKPSTRTLLRFVRAHPDEVRLIGIEDCFIGVNEKSSIMVAKNHAFVEGALWCAGWSGDLWTPRATEWRKDLGFRRKSESAHEDALSFARGRTGKSFDADHIHEAEAVCIASVAWERVARNASRPWVAT